MKKILIIAWNVSRIPWFRTLEKAIQTTDSRYSFTWVAVSRAEHIRLRIDRVDSLLLPIESSKTSSKNISCQLEEDEIEHLLSYESKLTNSPELKVLRETALQYFQWYWTVLKQEAPSLVICVNGWRLHTAAGVLAAEKLGVPTLYLENGYFPFTTVADPKGVNYAGSLTTLPLTEKIEEERLRGVIQQYHRGELSRPARVPGWKEFCARGISALLSTIPRMAAGSEFEEMSVSEAFESWRGESKRRSQKYDVGSIRRPYVFFPMQVEDDSQLIVHSPWIKSMEEAVEEILKVLPNDMQLVVKRHPSDRGRTPLDGIRELLADHGGAFVSSGSINKLLSDASAVVTINSTVGFEALTWHKPVVVLGEAPYARKGATFEANSPETLLHALRTALSGSQDHEMIDRVLYTALFEYLFPSGWKDPVLEEVEPIASYALALAGD